MLATIRSGTRVRSGEEVQRRANAVAGGLQAMGLGQGDVVALLMRNDIAFIEIMLGAERAGVTAVPLNWHGSLDELRHILDDSEAKVVFAHADLIGKYAELVASCTKVIGVEVPAELAQAYNVPESACQVPDFVAEWESWLMEAPTDVDQPLPQAFRLLYTSGSTGKPKGVLRRRGPDGAAEELAKTAREAHGLEIRPIRAVMTGPLYHSAPNSYALNCVRHGELLVLQPKFDAAELLELIELHNITHLHAVPTMFSRLLALPQEKREAHKLDSLRAVAHGSAMCPTAVKKAMIDWWGPVFFEYYAATETGIITCIDSHEWLAHPASVGRPPAGVSIRIVGPEGTALPPGQQGEIQLLSKVASLVEYKGLPEASRELLLEDGWATLGDIGYTDQDGYLWLCDRKKDLVISGGVNIFPAEVEQCLVGHPAVTDAIAFGVADDDMGEVICASIATNDPASVTEDSLRQWVRDRLGSLRTPKRIRIVTRLPREDTGKLARRKARDAFLADVRGEAHV